VYFFTSFFFFFQEQGCEITGFLPTSWLIQEQFEGEKWKESATLFFYYLLAVLEIAVEENPKFQFFQKDLWDDVEEEFKAFAADRSTPSHGANTLASLFAGENNEVQMNKLAQFFDLLRAENPLGTLLNKAIKYQYHSIIENNCEENYSMHDEDGDIVSITKEEYDKYEC